MPSTGDRAGKEEDTAEGEAEGQARSVSMNRTLS